MSRTPATPRASGQASPTAENIRMIADLERRAIRHQTTSERISDAISRLAGSLTFVGVHLVCFAAWAGWNAWARSEWRFDPYPYGLLTFFVSLEGVLLAVFVLIAQNRLSRQTDERDHLDLQINLLAEQEMTMMLRILRRISTKLDIPPESAEEARAETLAEETNVYELMQTLKREMRE
jgi:uncharacterized membrane protein